MDQQLKCGNSTCGNVLIASDAFCGYCGTPAPWASGPNQSYGLMPNGSPYVVPVTEPPFFTHEPPRQIGYLSNATRYLCAAAYLNRDFANTAVRNLIASRRAVAPSINFDVGPVLRHCLRARKDILIRDLLLVGIILLGLFISPFPTVDFLLIAFVFGVLLPNERLKRVRFARGILATVVLVVSFITIGAFTFFVVFDAFASALFSGASLSVALATVVAALAFTVLGPFILLAATTGVEYGYIRTTKKMLTEHLRPGAMPPQPTSSAVEARIAAVEGAQWGNITLYAAEDPFIGAGVQLDRHWEAAMPLEPKKAGQRSQSSRGQDRDVTQVPVGIGRVSIDPVELHNRIRQELLQLNDQRFPVNERISGLTVSDRLVGAGDLRWSSPLLDQGNLMPYSHASREAIEALIRSPQAGLRYFQHVSVNNEGPEVVSGGRQVLDGIDQGMAISAFVYTAIEGGMFYLQFAITVLPPILGRYQRMDQRPRLSLRRIFADTIFAPAGLYNAFRVWRQERRVLTPADFYDGTFVADLGAVVSVRELGTAADFGGYIRERDVIKYQQIIQRLLLKTVRDFLDEKGIDVTEFEGIATVINNDVLNIDARGANVQAGGPGSNFQQNNAPRARDKGN